MFSSDGSRVDSAGNKLGLISGSEQLKIGRTVLALAVSLALPAMAQAQSVGAGDLIVSGTTYQDVGQVSTISAGSLLAGSTAGTTSAATADGQFQNVFLNAGPDASFGVTSQVFLQDYATSGASTSSFVGQVNIDPAALVGSFSSKSELALNLTSDGSGITFMGYNPTQSFSSTGTGGVAAVTTGGNNNLGLLDISNSNTPGLTDPTDPVNAAAYRGVAQVSLGSMFSSATATGTPGVYTLGSGAGLSVTNTNAYSGNNGRAAVLVNGQYYMAGNAGNSGTGTTNTTLGQLSQNTGVQTIAAGASNANSTVVGACPSGAAGSKGYQCGFNVTQVGQAADKTGKDDNFRGMTVYNGNMYVTKGSGSNGVNTVYQVSGYANPATATISVLPGFSTALAKTATGTTANPFGLWFANSSTLYVAYEGDGAAFSASGAPAAGSFQGGLGKYSLVNGTWVQDYIVTAGFSEGYTAGNFSVAGGSSPTKFYTDGLRNITGRVNSDGTVTIFGVTSTVTDSSISSAWDQGANPDQIVSLTDILGATTLQNGEAFNTLQTANAGTVFRGVALDPVPEPETYAMMLAGLGLLGVAARRKKQQSA